VAAVCYEHHCIWCHSSTSVGAVLSRCDCNEALYQFHYQTRYLTETPSLRFNAHFPRWTWVSRFYWSWTIEAVVTTGAIRCANHHQQQPTPNFLQARCPSCCQTNSVKALKGKIDWNCEQIWSLCWRLLGSGMCSNECWSRCCCALSVVCAVRVIAECDIMQDFLASPDDNIVSCELILRFSFLLSLYFVAWHWFIVRNFRFTTVILILMLMSLMSTVRAFK